MKENGHEVEGRFDEVVERSVRRGAALTGGHPLPLPHERGPESRRAERREDVRRG